ncbi:Phosphoribosylanthranilate isomerase [Solidesulfovibrio carbinoliphilus subsp. oakridgensis]|uniref:N-(5'-phosphoribosyl)anthranilate isomerase n=1 Tax=Solidesulfovibrio carbinoliphilus subsp. oakridgensis TaxID=694327 RepID=G7QAV1_9BACT|nr:phosphoribosylanthranilate isomerase [Solidesulfovibrio carbinoliphilus]EHJ48292.1 Phosphoribosylanthranilate isomerase [Solidesulfovibrio carbinoliphilus subsp. oakridgensis]
MTPPLVKICGMTRPEDVLGCAEAGADLLGFIFAAKSPRRLTPGQAAALPRTSARRVGVFVEQTLGEVLAIMDEADLDLAQLHGGQDPDFCRAVGPDRVIRAFWPAKHPDTASLAAAMAAFAGTIRYALLDAGTSGGGHGVPLDFAPLAGLDPPMPWLLAGGLGPHNVAEALRVASPHGLDLNSGVESSPGLKDLEKVRRSLWTVKGCAGGAKMPPAAGGSSPPDPLKGD